MYKKLMGGVTGVDVCDVCDKQTSSEEIVVKIVSRALNLSVVAAFRFYEYMNTSMKMTYLQFRRIVATPLVKRPTTRVCRGDIKQNCRI